MGGVLSRFQVLLRAFHIIRIRAAARRTFKHREQVFVTCQSNAREKQAFGCRGNIGALWIMFFQSKKK